MILIGSQAFKLLAPKFVEREPKDFDFIATRAEFEGFLDKHRESIRPEKIYPIEGKNFLKMIVEGASILEFEIIQDDKSSREIHEMIAAEPETKHTDSFGMLPSLDWLFFMKTSHRYLKNSPHFWKNLRDYHIMKGLGAKIPDERRSLLKRREKETYDYAHPKLAGQSKDNFFVDTFYIHDHDSIHRAVAIKERPAYTYYMKDGAQVDCDKAKFFALPQEFRVNGIVEEAAVLAIERSLVPHPGKWTPEYAWHFAFMKVCTSITSGWFREFGYENAFECIRNRPRDYFEKFQAALADGRILPFTTENGQMAYSKNG